MPLSSTPSELDLLRPRDDLFLVDSSDHDVTNDAVTIDQEVRRNVGDREDGSRVSTVGIRGNQECGPVECRETGRVLCELVE